MHTIEDEEYSLRAKKEGKRNPVTLPSFRIGIVMYEVSRYVSNRGYPRGTGIDTALVITDPAILLEIYFDTKYIHTYIPNQPVSSL